MRVAGRSQCRAEQSGGVRSAHEQSHSVMQRSGAAVHHNRIESAPDTADARGATCARTHTHSTTPPHSAAALAVAEKKEKKKAA